MSFGQNINHIVGQLEYISLQAPFIDTAAIAGGVTGGVVLILILVSLMISIFLYCYFSTIFKYKHELEYAQQPVYE